MAETAPSAVELLAHRDWLLALARALVGEAAAPDIVQETFLVALAKPPSGALRPWLGGVARNLARMARRGGRRRETRELAAPQPDAIPSPGELVERARMQQVVAGLVLALPEPLRGTLLLRYFEGLSAADIARLQGIPAATVRGRLAEALARVRTSLDDDHGGRAAWIVLVAPLPLVAASGGSSSAALAAKGLLVSTSVKTGIVVVLVVAASLVGARALGWWGGEPSRATPIALPKPAGGSAPRAPVQPASAEPTVMGRLPELGHDDDPVGSIRLEGQVIDEHDQPVGGAHVAIDANPPKLATTEADGSFAFEGLIARAYRIEATITTDTIGRYAGPVRVRLHPDPEPVTLRMKEGGTVDVAVSDAATGGPVVGAQVELRSTLVWSATTTAAGMASLRGVGAVWAPLAVRAPGYAPAAMLLSTSGDPRAPVSVALKLARGAAITGTVVDEAGKPVGGARVVPTNASEPFPVVDARRDGVDSRPDGSFALPAVSAGTWRLTATQGVHAPATSAPITVDGVHPRDGVKLVV
ncbi:MAG: sigma-70 family RNA polymerase sigma factor, partial [Proteobacteria bacterium]|nr:sigma-70 family RNA polymerase sigma factor [Pseudomonadota bacterium]